MTFEVRPCRDTAECARALNGWTARPLRMPDEEKANPRKFVVVELDGRVQAYAIYRAPPASSGA